MSCHVKNTNVQPVNYVYQDRGFVMVLSIVDMMIRRMKVVIVVSISLKCVDRTFNH